MKTSSKTTTKTNEKEVKKEFNLKEAFVLWRNQSKAGAYYLSGNVSNEEKTKLVGYFNTNKKNPKEPDVRIYLIDCEGNQGNEVCSLWEYISKNENSYLSGTTDEKEKIIAFYGKKNEEARPYIRAYYRED